MPLFEVLLHRDEGDELRLTDEPLRVGENVSIAGQRWLVEREEPAEQPGAEARYICVPSE